MAAASSASESRVALVTGRAPRGSAMSWRSTLAAHGYRVILHARHSAAEAQATVEQLRQAGVQAGAVTADLTDEASVAAMSRGAGAVRPHRRAGQLRGGLDFQNAGRNHRRRRATASGKQCLGDVSLLSARRAYDGRPALGRSDRESGGLGDRAALLELRRILSFQGRHSGAHSHVRGRVGSPQSATCESTPYCRGPR